MIKWNQETAEWYAENYGEYPTNRLVIEQLELAPDCTVVDIGCGTASALRHAPAKVTTGKLIGIDPVPRMLEIARERLAEHPAADRIELHAAPAHAIPLPSHSADVVLALDSYDHWVPCQQGGLAEARRILAPNGRFVVVKDANLPEPEAARRAFIAALECEGFEVVEERETDDGHQVVFTTWICMGSGHTEQASD